MWKKSASASIDFFPFDCANTTDPTSSPSSHASRTHLMLNTRVLSLSVLSDKNSVHIVVSGLVTSNRDTRSNVGEEGESSSESQVEGNVTLTDCESERSERAGRKKGGWGTKKKTSAGLVS